ncbi:MAG: hypothetical protein KGJ98_08655 [Chloroflexota bacterium]|nr:hypothetical protein [Chloroflexota bacterium]MDE3102292.1 hypothetical protein [Chloroflexota bacterium]
MSELGIDISQQRSKTLDRYINDAFDYVITPCLAHRTIEQALHLLNGAGAIHHDASGGG